MLYQFSAASCFDHRCLSENKISRFNCCSMKRNQSATTISSIETKSSLATNQSINSEKKYVSTGIHDRSQSHKSISLGDLVLYGSCLTLLCASRSIVRSETLIDH